MAQAKIETTTREVEKVVKVQETEKTVTLTLTMAEAAVLRFVLAYVGGSPDTTPRGLTEHVHWALRQAGVKAPDHWTLGGKRKFVEPSSGIYFVGQDSLERFNAEVARLHP